MENLSCIFDMLTAKIIYWILKIIEINAQKHFFYKKIKNVHQVLKSSHNPIFETFSVKKKFWKLLNHIS